MLEELGAPKSFGDIANQPRGIVLVTGPTGSGKSTTLYSVLKELNGDDINLCTIEDPIEFNLPWVNQFQAKTNVRPVRAEAADGLRVRRPGSVA